MRSYSRVHDNFDFDIKSDTKSDIHDNISAQLEEFFFYLTKDHIMDIFQKFRECENKKNSRIPFKEFCNYLIIRWNHDFSFWEKASISFWDILFPIPSIRENRGGLDYCVYSNT